MDAKPNETYPPWQRSIIQLVLIALALAACAFGGASLNPLIESVRIGLRLTDNQIAIAQGTAVAVPILLTSIPLGLYIDHGRRARLLQLLVLLAGVCAVATALAVGPVSFIAAKGASGLVAASTYPVALSLVSDLFAPARRGRASMLLSVGAMLGTAGGYAAGGAVGNYFAGASLGWRGAMFVIAAPLVAYSALLFTVREPTRISVSSTRFSVAEIRSAVWSYRGILLPLTVAMTTVSMADMASIIWTAPLMHRAFGLDAGHVGAVISVSLLVAGLATPVITGVLSDRIYKGVGVGGVILFALALTLITIPVSFYPVAHSLRSFVLGFWIVASGGIAVHMEIALLFVLLVPNELRGLFISSCSAVSTVFSLGIAPIAVTLIASKLTASLPLATALSWVMLSTSLLSASATAWIFLRRRPHAAAILTLRES